MLNWSGRLESHLGNYTVEPIKLWSSYILNRKVNLHGINSICSIIISTMAEKQQNAFMYEKSLSLIKIYVKIKKIGSKVIFLGN